MGPKKTPTEVPVATTTAQKTTPAVKKTKPKKEGEKKQEREVDMKLSLFISTKS